MGHTSAFHHVTSTFISELLKMLFHHPPLPASKHLHVLAYLGNTCVVGTIYLLFCHHSQIESLVKTGIYAQSQYIIPHDLGWLSTEYWKAHSMKYTKLTVAPPSERTTT